MDRASLSLLALGLAATLGACNGDTGLEQRCETPSAVDPPINRAFNIQVGSTVSVDDDGLQISFVGVDGESRCPSDVQCIVAGTVVVRLTGQPAGRGVETFTLESGNATSQSQALAIDNGAYIVELGKVEPYPISTRSIAADGYCATLTVFKELQ